ncbi:MAG TPA: ferredoxin [Methanobacterium sp.]|jgi:ferredoxin
MTTESNNKQSLPYKVVVERDRCTSCGSCEDLCPELFELDDGGISHIIGSERVGNNDELEMEDEKCSLDAAESCPVMIIHVYEDGEDLL